jgi:hypothetical protein
MEPADALELSVQTLHVAQRAQQDLVSLTEGLAATKRQLRSACYNVNETLQLLRRTELFTLCGEHIGRSGEI